MVYFARIEVASYQLRQIYQSKFDRRSGRRIYFVKIGSSVNPPSRIKYLQWEYGKPMELLLVLPGGRTEERAMHQRFAHLRVDTMGPSGKAEWFYPVPELMDFIEAGKNL